jgi:hypothetical protein
VAVDQLLALYECHEAKCESSPSEPSGSCVDVGASLPGTIWTGVICEDGSSRSPCPTGSDRIVYYYRFNRDGTYQLDSISDFGGRISSGGDAGRWRTSCGTLSLLTCGGDEVQRIATDGGLRIANMLGPRRRTRDLRLQLPLRPHRRRRRRSSHPSPPTRTRRQSCSSPHHRDGRRTRSAGSAAEPVPRSRTRPLVTPAPTSRIVLNRPETSGIVWNRPESSGIVRNRSESFG